MEYETNYRKKHICINCGKSGHESKSCREAITSYGIMNIDIVDNTNEKLIIKDKFSIRKDTLYKITSRKYPDIKCYISNNSKLNSTCNQHGHNSNNVYKLDNDTIRYDDDEQIRKFCYYKDKIMFMMVSRKFSIGFIEFIRGKYDVSDAKTIINLFEQMYEDEIKYIRKNQYDNILYYFLNRNNEPKDVVLNRVYEGKYSQEYCEAKIKFNMLLDTDNATRTDDTIDGIPLGLDFYTKYIRPKWKKPEWGFPKGRRDNKIEENLTCACREFEEETGYRQSDYNVLNKIEPIEEEMVGTNNVNYKHIYYLAINNRECNNNFDNYDIYEIGEIKWFTYHEAISNIRPYHNEKKKILTQVYLFILNYLIHNDCLMMDE